MAGALHFADINDLAQIKRTKIDKSLVTQTLSRAGDLRK
jgi:hypothetical protein